MPQFVLLMSGGLDSSAAAYMLRAENKSFVGVFASHNTNEIERSLTQRLCGELGISLHELNFGPMQSLLTAIGNPKVTRMSFGGQIGQCGDDPMQMTSKPFLSVELLHMQSALVAIACDASEIIWSIHQDDLTPEFDLSKTIAYKSRIEDLIFFTTGRPVKLGMPFINMTKAQVVERGVALGLNVEHTWSCSAHAEVPCGVCKQCRKRQVALSMLGANDVFQTGKSALAA